jgi:large subunit ribosomal protein LP0
MEPGKTSFFQALGVPTKIARGTIEITTDLKLVEAGSKVGPSEATLLNLLNISPFTYGMGISQVYDEGQTFDVSVLDISEDQLLGTLAKAVTTIATISLAIDFPTVPSVFHSVVNSYKKVLAVAIETEISWPEIEELKDRIANPDAYASAAPAAAAAGGDAAPAEEEKKDESEEEEDEEGFGGLLYANITPHLPRKASNMLTVSPAIKPSTATSLCLSRFLWDRLRLWEEDFEQRFNRRFANQLHPTLRPNEIMIIRHQRLCLK